MTNAVAEAIDRLGGLTPATVKTGIPTATLAYWRAQGRISRAEACFRIESLTGISARALAGLEGTSPRPYGRRRRIGTAKMANSTLARLANPPREPIDDLPPTGRQVQVVLRLL